MTKQRVKEQFGATAESYAVSRVHAQGASLARLVELIQPQAHWRVLDVATGAGHTAFAFAPHVQQVIASDLTPQMLATTARLAAEKGLSNLSVEEADAEALPFADGTFDLVTCRIAPHHFPDVAQFVRECARVLTGGGLLALVDNVVPGSLASDGAGSAQRAVGDYVNMLEKLRDSSHHRCLSLAEWEALFQQSGFTVRHSEIAPKAMAFNEWATRMPLSSETLAELRRRFVDAPLAVLDFLQVEAVEDDLHFVLAEALMIGKH